MKTAVITGSTKGIGKAIGIKLLDSGYYVLFNYASDDEGCELLKEEIAEYIGKFKVIKNDFSTEEKIDDFVNQVLCHAGGDINTLVLNAGITDRTPWEHMSMKQWNHVMHVNLTVPTFLTQKIGKHISSKGSILYIGSILGEYAHSMSVPYGVSKAGLHFLAESLVKEYCDKGITVNAICTGFTDTQWQKNKSEEQRSRIINKIGMRRFAEPEEIASLAFELLTNGYITGSVVKIDGGYCCL